MSAQLFEFLQQQPGVTFIKLYRQPSTALAVLRRMLPHFAKTIVMAMLFMPEPFLASDLETWFRPDSRPVLEDAITTLERLNIMTRVPEPLIPKAYQLQPIFAKSLRDALTGEGDHKSFGVPHEPPAAEQVDVDFLDKYARGQWEAILFFIVGNIGLGLLQTHSTLSKGTQQLLQMGNFVQISRQGTRITQEGFTFLLQEANAQVWTLLIVYLGFGDSVRRHLSTRRNRSGMSQYKLLASQIIARALTTISHS